MLVELIENRKKTCPYTRRSLSEYAKYCSKKIKKLKRNKTEKIFFLKAERYHAQSMSFRLCPGTRAIKQWREKAKKAVFQSLKIPRNVFSDREIQFYKIFLQAHLSLSLFEWQASFDSFHLAKSFLFSEEDFLKKEIESFCQYCSYRAEIELKISEKTLLEIKESLNLLQKNTEELFHIHSFLLLTPGEKFFVSKNKKLRREIYFLSKTNESLAVCLFYLLESLDVFDFKNVSLIHLEKASAILKTIPPSSITSLLKKTLDELFFFCFDRPVFLYSAPKWDLFSETFSLQPLPLSPTYSEEELNVSFQSERNQGRLHHFFRFLGLK